MRPERPGPSLVPRSNLPAFLRVTLKSWEIGPGDEATQGPNPRPIINQRRSRSPSRFLVQAMADHKGIYSFILLALISITNAQSQPCPPITISDLGSTISFCSDGLVAVGLVPPGESVPSIPVRILNYTNI